MSYGYDISANRFKQSYFKGFVDISGDGIRMRNDMSINFFDTTNSSTPKFSIKSETMRIVDSNGNAYDISNSQLLYIRDLSQSAQQQLNDLQHRTAHIQSDVSDNKTMLLFDSASQSVGVYANIIPAKANTYDLGSVSHPFHSLYVNQGTIHFIADTGAELAASISFNTDSGSLDLSAGGYTTSLNNTRYIDGVLSTPLLSYGGNVGIGVSNPTAALDISGGVVVAGNTLFNGGVTIANGDLSLNGNVITSSITTNSLVVNSGVFNSGDLSLNGRLYSQGDVSLNSNLYVNGISTLTGKLQCLSDVSVTGNVFAQTQITNDSSTRVATTAYVKNQAYATLASPTFSGNMVIPTAAIHNNLLVFGNAMFYGNAVALTQFTDDNSTKLATTAYVKNQAYATLASPTFSGIATIPTATISQKLSVTGDASLNGNTTFTGKTTSITAPTSDNSTTIATTAYVKNQGYATLAGANFTGSISTTNDITVAGSTNLRGPVTVTADMSLNGNVLAPTQSIADNSTRVATTAYVQNQAYATLASPALTGIPTAPTASIGSFTTQIATTEYVRNEVTSFINSIPSAFDAIQQLSSALSNTDAAFATQLATELSTKAPINTPTFTGIVTIPDLVVTNSILASGQVTMNNDLQVNGVITATTASLWDNSTKVATTEYVQGQAYAHLAGANFTGDIGTIGNITVGKTVFANTIAVSGNITSQSVSVGGDLNVIGNAYVPTPNTTDNSTLVATTAYVQNQGYAQLSGATFTGPVTTGSHFVATADVSLNQRLDVQGPMRIQNSVSVTGDASFNANMYVGGAIYENGASLINKYATLNSPTFTGTVNGISKSMVGLGNVDNTSDANKPISTATQSALQTKADVYNPTIQGNLTVTANLIAPRSTIANLVVTDGAIFSGLITTISDISMVGNAYAPTMTTAENSSHVATTAYVQNQNYAKQSGATFTGAVSIHNTASVIGDTSLNGNLFVANSMSLYGNLHVVATTTLSDTTVQGNFVANAPTQFNAQTLMVGDVSMNGNAYAPTMSITENSNRLATTAYVQNQGYATVISPNLTGVPTAPTAPVGTLTTQIATTEYVRNEVSNFVNALPNTLDLINNLSNTLSSESASFAASLSSTLESKANIANPTFTGNAMLPTTWIMNTLDVSGITTLRNTVYITGDLSLAGNLGITYHANTIPSAAVIDLPGRNGIFDNDISMNHRLYVGEDVSLNSGLYVGKTATFQGPIYSMNDASFTKNITVSGNTRVNKLIATNDVSLNANLFLGGKLYSNSTIYENGNALATTYAAIQSPTFQGTATFSKLTTTDTFTAGANAIVHGKFSVVSDTSMNGNVYVGGSISENGTSLITKYATLNSPTFTGTVSGITKTMVGLSNVDNTSDADKPVSTAQQTALNLKSDVNSPIFTGIPLAPTATTGTNTSQIATTSFVQGEISNLVGSAPATLNTLQELSTAINSDASFAATVATSIGLKAPINNPTFTGTVALPTTVISQTLNVGQDTSITGNLTVGGYMTAQYPDKSIPSTAIDNIANQYGKFMFQTQRNDVVTFDDEHFETSISAGNIPYIETLYATTSDLSLNGNIYIHGTGVSIFDSDISCNKQLYVNGSIYEEGVALAAKYAPLSAPSFTTTVTMRDITITQDASINGNLFTRGIIYENGSSLTSTYSKLASPTFTGTVTISNDLSANANVYVSGEIYQKGASLDSTYSKLASPTFTGVVTVPTLTTTSDVSMNTKLTVGGNTTLQSMLDVSGAIFAHNNLNLSGIINQYTLSLEDGNKVSFDTASQISTLQSQVSTLQTQLANVVQILARHNLA